jgi:hypothetical protein
MIPSTISSDEPLLYGRYAIPAAQLKAWKPLLDNVGLQRVLKRLKRNRGEVVLPDIVSDDAETLRVAERLVKALNEALPVTVTDNGAVGANGVAGDFNALLNTAGHFMSPISTPPVNNREIRRALGLVDNFVSNRHRDIAKLLVRLMFSEPVPAKVSIRRQASTCSPDYTNDVPKKKRELRKALAELDKFLALVERDELGELYVEYNATIIHTIGERAQPDSVTIDDGVARVKEREANDEEAARTGLKGGQRIPADRRVVVNGRTVENHFALRRRTVFGMSFVPNYVVAAIFGSWRATYLESYSFTWKHRTPESILEKMQRFRLLAGFDVKQFDQSVPTFLIDFFCDELGNYVDTRIAKLVRLMFKAPYIMPYPYVDGDTRARPTNPLFGADPFDVASFTMELGLPSGIACNPDFGKFAMTWQYLCLCDDYFHDVLETGLDTILRGEHHHYGLLNMTDDCVVLTNDEGFYRHVLAEEYQRNYFGLEKESPISFLGNVPYIDDRGELRLAPNIISFFVNWLVPEHGITSRHRRDFWAVGDRERRQHYAKSPAYSTAYAIYDEIFSEAFGRSPGSITAEYYDAQKAMSSMSFIDALVLQNPDYLHYRFDEGDVSPEVLDELVTSLPADEVWNCTQSFFK